MDSDVAHVAPRTGAWIETMNLVVIVSKRSVAPRTGAWIETDGRMYAEKQSQGVAPRTGAWIETSQYPTAGYWHGWSRPARARGLKLAFSSHRMYNGHINNTLRGSL